MDLYDNGRENILYVPYRSNGPVSTRHPLVQDPDTNDPCSFLTFVDTPDSRLPPVVQI
jgi:hypothetical protein